MENETCNIMIYNKNKELIVKEKCLVAYDSDTNKVLALGTQAKEAENFPAYNLNVISPIKNGFIINFELAEMMFKYFINITHTRKLFSKPKVIICLPYKIPEDEEDNYRKIMHLLKAKLVLITDESIDRILAQDRKDYSLAIDISA